MAPELLLATALLAPLVGAIAPGRRADRIGTGLGALAAIALLVVVSEDGPVAVFDGWITADRLGALWLVFVILTIATVRRFAGGSLAADTTRDRFLRLSACSGAGGALLVVAGNLWALVLASALSGLAAAAVLAYDGRASATRASVQALRSFVLGDLALLVAAVIVASDVGSTSFGRLDEASGAARDVAAVLIVVAALLRCAQLPMHRWLVRSLAAPTPASALLHAGVVNGGGVILIRSAGLTNASPIAVALGITVATLGIVVAAAVMRSRADVKGGLVWSTIAQMGFMLVQSLLGLTAAAGLHMIAHGMYKANLFLRSGSTLEHRSHLRRLELGRAMTGAVFVASVAVAGIAVLVSGFHLLEDDGAGILIGAFAALTIFHVLLAAVGATPRIARRVALTTLAVGGLTTAYLAALAFLEDWADLPSTPLANGGLVAGIVVAVTVLGALATNPSSQARAGRFRLALSTRVMALGRAPLLPEYRIRPRAGATA